jgi:NitT/TauT family transport system ATP-binding protein
MIDRPQSAAPKLRIRGVSKTFQKQREKLLVLDRIDLDVAEGEFICLLGPSGCGKSTLLNLCAGFEPFDQGAIEIDGQLVDGPNPKRVFVFQEYGVFPWMSVWDNIAFGLSSRSRQEKHAIVARYIEMIGLQGFERTYPMELSGGMKQRVAVARALAVDPDVLFMDEAFGALDSLTRLHMRAELVRIWSSERRTVLFVTHDIEESVQMAQRVVVMSPRPGRIKKVLDLHHLPYPRDIDSPEYVAARDELYEAMGVSTRIGDRR